MVRPRNLEKEPFSKSSNKAALAGPRFTILTLFPESIEPLIHSSILGRAIADGKVAVECLQIRDFAEDKHRRVDDSPYGGGAGMILKYDVLYRAWKKAVGPRRRGSQSTTILLSPQGQKLDQARAKSLVKIKHIVLVCGHYEGVDERFIEECVDLEISIGDYILTGGELPALVVLDSVCRFIPGVVGKAENVSEDSLEGGLLKYPQYTRPAVFRKKTIPEILLSGNHTKIRKWRDDLRRERTESRRPDLLQQKSPKKDP